MTGRDPLTRQSSPWTREPGDDMTLEGSVEARAWSRSVHDGYLSALVSIDPHGHHLSVAHHNHPSRRTRANRYPTWDEIAHARYTLCPDDIDMIMILPALDDYLACHPTTFHLHQVDDLPPTAVDRPRR